MYGLSQTFAKLALFYCFKQTFWKLFSNTIFIMTTQAIFVAHGPGFKEKTEVKPFENIEVYNLMCGEY